MARAHIIVLDGFGIGHAPDAAAYGDAGADTFGHVARAREAAGGTLRLPNLERLGLHAAADAAGGAGAAHGGTIGTGASHGAVTGRWTHASEVSAGKDTPSGHWEIAGVPVPFDWHVFPPRDSFPPGLVAAIVGRAGLPGILGDEAASGTEIIARLGDEHVRSGRPILYTSADSVMQIAAHEEAFGLERLMELCRIAREEIDRAGLNVGRVIARPFLGAAGAYERTANRRDLAVSPPEPTLLDRARAAGRRTLCVGKIADIYAHSGVTDEIKASGNAALTEACLGAIGSAGEGDLTMTNLVDFDMLYGHRRDPEGFAAALEAFDARLPAIEAGLREGDMLVLTADHGCDPTWRGTDHTRERVPVLISGPGLGAGPMRAAGTFADIGETVAAHLGLAPGPHGRTLL